MAEQGAASAASGNDSDQGRPSQHSANLRGIALIIAAMAAFCLNDTLTKSTFGELPMGEIITIRGIFANLILAPVVLMSYGLANIVRSYSVPLMIRNASEIASVFLFLGALFRLPLANVTAILQTLPLTMTAAAAILFGERVGWRRWTAAAVGLVGVVLIIQPGSVEFSWWYVSAIAAVFFITSRDIATRYITQSTPTLIITFITAMVVTLAGAVIGLTETWVVPETLTLVRLAAAAVFVLIGYYCLIECWRGTEISVIAPFRYSIVIWAMIFGYALLGEVPSLTTAIGSTVVVAAGLYTFHRERMTRPAA